MRKLLPLLSRRKDVELLQQEIESRDLRKVLDWYDVLGVGLGQIIGAGIFVLTGIVARDKAGAGVVISFLLAGISCVFSALCYAEFSSRVPLSGSAYTYAYHVGGEFLAWFIGWDLTLEYNLAAATVAKGWSGYIAVLFDGFGVNVPPSVIEPDIGFKIDPLAAAVLVVLTLLLSFGVKESSRVNVILVIWTLVVIVAVIIGGLFYVETNNWSPFAPYGIRGILSGSAIVFFSFIGFDAVTTVAEEMKHPKRDLPLGVIGSLLLSAVLYVGVATVLTLAVDYKEIDPKSPVASMFASHGAKWLQIVVSLGAFAALLTTIQNSLLGQARIYFCMASDGLLWPWFAKIHPRFRTPFNAQLFCGVFCTILAFFFPIEDLAEMVSIGTLLAFDIVCCAVLFVRYLPEDRTKIAILIGAISALTLISSAGVALDWHISVPILFGILSLLVSSTFFFLKKNQIPPAVFACPFVPIIPLLGIYSNLYMMASLSKWTWLRLFVWCLVGFCIYFGYSIRNSKLAQNPGLTQEETSGLDSLFQLFIPSRTR